MSGPGCGLKPCSQEAVLVVGLIALSVASVKFRQKGISKVW